MDFRILGPFEATGDAGPVTLAPGKQKALLALLLLHADRVVPMDRLIDDLWGDDVPETARKMVQIFVSQLRKQLPDGLLYTRAPGYLVELDGHSLDLRRFEELHAGGGGTRARPSPRGRRGIPRSALALARPGPRGVRGAVRPGGGRPTCRAAPHLPRGAHRGGFALEHHVELVAELDALVRRHPHRERLRGQLMLALYRSGRHAEALESYQAFRRMLDDELGIEPSARLRELERRMLQQDASLELKAQAGHDRTVRRAGHRSFGCGRSPRP